jgi:RHS repeat-associated protein
MVARNWTRVGDRATRDLFQGKTYDDLTKWYDFHARQYDAALGRWFAMDPQNQFASPFTGMGNNPVNGVDPDGEWFFTALFTAILPPLAPLCVILDGAAWSATIDAGIQGMQIAAGIQDKFDWSRLVISPDFSVTSTRFKTNLPTYLKKAGYAALTGAASTGTGLLASDLFDNGRIDYSFNQYIKAMGTAGIFSGGLSFAGSMSDYLTWDRLSTADKIMKLQNKFGSNVKFDPNTPHYGYYQPGSTDIFLGPPALESKRIAYLTTRHELKHLNDYKSFRNKGI